MNGGQLTAHCSQIIHTQLTLLSNSIKLITTCAYNIFHLKFEFQFGWLNKSIKIILNLRGTHEQVYLCTNDVYMKLYNNLTFNSFIKTVQFFVQNKKTFAQPTTTHKHTQISEKPHLIITLCVIFLFYIFFVLYFNNNKFNAKYICFQVFYTRMFFMDLHILFMCVRCKQNEKKNGILSTILITSNGLKHRN